MNNKITIRQAGYIFIFMTLSPILRQIPRIVAMEDGNEILSLLISFVLTIAFTAITIYILKKHQGMNIYDILSSIFGKIISKLILIILSFWLCILASIRINYYILMMQLTIMPNTKSYVFILVMALLVLYAMSKGLKAVFRISEFTLGFALLVLFLFIIFAIPNINYTYIIPNNILSNRISMKSISSVLSIGINIIMLLFISEKLDTKNYNEYLKKFWKYSLFVFGLACIIIIISIGILGTKLAGKNLFSFYTAVKSISFMKLFERLEILITLICILSDFITICFYIFVIGNCMNYCFHMKPMITFGIITIIILAFSKYIGNTQFFFEYLYQNYIIEMNILLFGALGIFIYLFSWIKLVINNKRRN